MLTYYLSTNRQQGTPDWTVTHPEGDLAPHVIFARSIDWSTTPLGDMSTWSREFRQICNHLMANPHPAALFWGEEVNRIFLSSYAMILRYLLQVPS